MRRACSQMLHAVLASDLNAGTGSRSMKKISLPSVDLAEEKYCAFLSQVLIPILAAGLGMVSAGITLDIVKAWHVFRQHSEIFVIIPALIGLKGNLEMTLASRLSTQANLGFLSRWSYAWRIIVGNLALTQVQAVVVGLLASLTALLVTADFRHVVEDAHASSSNANLTVVSEPNRSAATKFFLVCVSIMTASITSFLIGSVMILVILLAHRFGYNPDNIATPIAAGMGDLLTLIILSFVADTFRFYLDSMYWWPICVAFLFIYFVLTILLVVSTARNTYTRIALTQGWIPVIGAMLISSAGGYILKSVVHLYNGLAIYQPIINGVGGNLAAVQASRVSTSLHLAKQRCSLTLDTSVAVTRAHKRSGRVLLALVVPVQTFLLLLTWTWYPNRIPDKVHYFLVLYNAACFLQVFLLLVIADRLVRWLWRQNLDPDNAAIPYLTSLGDLLGAAFLAGAFFCLTDSSTDA